MIIRLIDISQFTWDLYNSADRVYYIGSKTIDKCKTDSKALKKEKKYWRKEQKFSIKHNILPTEEMYTWLDNHADYENSTNWYEVFHEQFAQWYISEKYNEFEKFITKIRMSAANETLIITDDNPDEWWSIRSIIGGILNRYQHNGFVRDREWDWQTAYGFTEDEEPIPGYTLYKDYLNYYLYFQEQNYHMPITQTVDSKGNTKIEYGVHRVHKMRIYPDKRQEWEFNKTIQACEYIYNRILAEQKELDRKHIEEGRPKVYYNKEDAEKRMREIRRESGNEWLNDEDKVSKAFKDRKWIPQSRVLQEVVRNNLETGFIKYKEYRNLHPKEDIWKGYPKFKDYKGPLKSFTLSIHYNNIDFKDVYKSSNIYNRKNIESISYRYLYLSFITNNIKCHHNRIPFTGSTGEITRCTISKSKTGRWFASVSYRYMPVKNKELYIIRPDDVVVNTEPLKAIGIDLGITTYITGTDTLGNTLEIPNPTFAQQYEKRLAKLNRQLALKEDTKFKVDENGEYILSQYGNKVYSNNYRKQKLKITKLFEKVTNKKIDFQNRLSKQLIKNYDYIFLEDLEISSMIRETEEYLRTTRLKQTRRYNLADAAFYRFTQMLEYKGKWYNTTIQKVDKYFPSTRLCSYCQTKYPENLLSNIKEWVCLNPNCPTHQSLPGIPFKIPRDINASINLLR